jgi:hypothetical protein
MSKTIRIDTFLSFSRRTFTIAYLNLILAKDIVA